MKNFMKTREDTIRYMHKHGWKIGEIADYIGTSKHSIRSTLKRRVNFKDWVSNDSFFYISETLFLSEFAEKTRL